MPGKLILIRHGQSIWNVENLFTGWYDVDLSETGREEAVTRRARAREGESRAENRLHLRAEARDPHALADTRRDATACGCPWSAAGG